jgi:4-diphosphocytidyl-2-C-methyl-D-erythritol kinase
MIEVRAPAKLTWFLEITAQRSDGYHILRSEMVSLDLADSLTFSEGTGVTFHGSRLGVSELDIDDNLVTRALALVGREARVEVTKEIPLGGGLGGGSADAAAVLRWAGFSDLQVAAKLGGDVPFCLLGGRALVEGIGEIVRPLEFEARTVTLFLPSFSVNTAECYRAFDELGQTPRGRNHLTAAAWVVEPRLKELMGWIDANYGGSVLAGSGSTVFVEGDVVDGTSRIVESPVGPVEVLVTKTIPA